MKEYNKSKKVKKAAALFYDPSDTAPRITALGKGELAERIIKTAEANNVPIFKNSELVDTLVELELGERIPPELYEVVADILLFVLRIDKLKGEVYGAE